jgi:hypothetical protein
VNYFFSERIQANQMSRGILKKQIQQNRMGGNTRLILEESQI